MHAAPLAGLTVVDATRHRAGSIAGMLLADLGATVTRVETTDGAHRRGDPRRFPDPVCWDRHKRTAVVSSLDPGRDAELASLLGGAEVLLVDLTPGELAPSPLHPDRLAAENPRLVGVWTPPHGRTDGRHQDLPADPLLQAAVTAYAMHQPAFDPEVPIAPVVPVIEAVQGSLAASAAVAGALDAAESGAGQLATVTGVDAAGVLLATLVNASLDVPKAYSMGRSPRIGPNFLPYRCADGEMLFLAALVQPLFIKALDVLDAVEVMVLEGVEGEFFNLFVPEIGSRAVAVLEARFATRPRQHWLDRFSEAGVPAEPVLSREAWVASEQFAATGGRDRFEHPTVGTVRTPAHPAGFRVTGEEVDTSAAWPRRSGPDAGPGPLAGLRVLDVSNFLAGPYAPTVLAFWGADVVKVEPADGDPYRAYGVSYLAVNQAKRSAHLDLEDPRDRELFDHLVQGADVMVDNLRPSTRTKLGLDLDALHAQNPALIHGNVTAFGTGPFAERPGFDPCIQALSGMMQASGPPGEPLNTTTPVHDVAAASSLALGILAALWQRSRTGTVSAVTTSLAAASSLLQCAELTDFDGRPATARGDIDFVGESPDHCFHRAADGWVGVAAPSPEALAAALGVESTSSADEDLGAAITERIASWTVAEVLGVLETASIQAAAPIGETWDRDPFLDENQQSHVVMEPTFGRCRVMRGPGTFSRSGVVAVEEMVEAGGDTDQLRARGWDAPT